MQFMKKTTLICLLAATLSAQATLYTTNWNSGFANAGVVPDNNFSGWSDSRSVSTMPAGTFTGLSVDLNSPAAGTVTSTPTWFTAPASACCWIASAHLARARSATATRA